MKAYNIMYNIWCTRGFGHGPQVLGLEDSGRDAISCQFIIIISTLQRSTISVGVGVAGRWRRDAFP